MVGSAPQCVPILQVSQIALSLEFYVDRPPDREGPAAQTAPLAAPLEEGGWLQHP